MPAKSPKIVVIGAGPIGLYTSMVLASVGCQVSLIDDGKRGAGWASGGMLGAAHEILGAANVPDDYKTFAQGSQWLWGLFLKSTEVPIVPGSVFLARTDSEAQHLGALAQAVQARDLPMSACEVPVGVRAMHAWYALNDIAFDPRHMLTVLRKECALKGVAFIVGTAQHIESGRVTLGDSSLVEADQIIIATGMAGRGLAQCVPELANLVPVKGQMMAVEVGLEPGIPMPHLDGIAALACRAPSTVIRAGRVYLVPRGNRIVIGATSNPDDTDDTLLDKDAHAELFEEAAAWYPNLKSGRIIESWAGLRPMTPDGLPLLGYGQQKRIILATGTYRNGWLLAAGIANAVMGLVLDEKDTTANLQSLSPSRFPI